MIAAVSIPRRAPVKECSAFRIKRCSTTLLPQRILLIVYISICFQIIKWLLQVKICSVYTMWEITCVGVTY